MHSALIIVRIIYLISASLIPTKFRNFLTWSRSCLRRSDIIVKTGGRCGGRDLISPVFCIRRPRLSPWQRWRTCPDKSVIRSSRQVENAKDYLCISDPAPSIWHTVRRSCRCIAVLSPCWEMLGCSGVFFWFWIFACWGARVSGSRRTRPSWRTWRRATVNDHTAINKYFYIYLGRRWEACMLNCRYVGTLVWFIFSTLWCWRGT